MIKKILEPPDIENDVNHAREVLSKVRNPRHRYQLTMLLEVAAQQFMHLDNDPPPTEELSHESRPRKIASSKH
jgi:hypothetical protein